MRRLSAGRTHRGRKVQSEGQYVVRAKTRIYVPERVEGAYHQARANEQDQRQRHFHRDQDALRAAPSPAAAPAFFERFRQTPPRNLQRRSQPRQRPGAQRNGEREEQHAAVQPDFVRARQRRRQRAQRGLCAPGGKQQSQRAARQRQQRALSQQLTEQPPLARAQRSANGEFARPAGGARQQ